MISLLGIVMTSFSFINVVVVKYVSAGTNKSNQALFTWLTRKSVIFGIILASVFALAAHSISQFLKIDQKIVLILTPFFIFSILSTVYKAFLQGSLKFKELTITSNLDLLGRLSFGVIFVYFGMSVFGGILGIVLGAFTAFVLARFFLRDYRTTDSKVKFTKIKDIAAYSIPVFISSAATLSLLSTDVILVKHFFDPHVAGLYAALSTLGRIIYFGATPVSAVMFPMVSKKHSKGESYLKIFAFSLVLTLFISLAVLGIYWQFPEFSIKMLYGSGYVEASPLLLHFGLFVAICTLSIFMLQFFISRFKTSAAYLVLIGAIVQIVGIWLFHRSLNQVINVSITVSSLLLVSLFVYFAYERKTSTEI